MDAVYWYDTLDSNTKSPVLYYYIPDKSGTGFDSGEYDVHSNGSLIIQNVSLSHDHFFRALVMYSDFNQDCTEDIRVIVIGKIYVI